MGVVEQLKIIQQIEAAQMILLRPVYNIEANRGISSWVRTNTRKDNENTLSTQKMLLVICWGIKKK